MWREKQPTSNGRVENKDNKMDSTFQNFSAETIQNFEASLHYFD